ncbi:MAG: PD40 domain-containing protein [Bacteroidetes bacterium]|nr:PD40 domain-containing protein [Bacteroidota bacterium]
MKKIILILIWCLGPMIMVTGQEQQAEKLLSKAIYQEEVNGELDEAIKTYQLIVKQYPDKRNVSAEALLHLGMCYEKLGLLQAHETYLDLINKYPEQKDEVAIAKERVNYLNAYAADINKKAEQHLKEGNRLLGLWEYESAIKEYENAIKLDPNNLLAQNAQYCIGQSWFRAGRHDIALTTFENLIEEFPESTIAPVTELMVAQVQYAMKNNKNQGMRKNYSSENTIIDPETGITYTKTNTFTGKNDLIRQTGGFNLSPDGRFIVLENKVVPLDGSDPFNLVDMKALRAVYAPGMKRAAFYADSAIWTVPVSPETGHANGQPKKLLDGSYIYQHIVSWSPDGKKIAFTRRDKTIAEDIWVISISDSKLMPVTNSLGTEHSPAWSPDGKTIAYRKESAIWLASVNGNKTEMILKNGGYPQWSPDCKWLFHSNWENKHLYSLDGNKNLRFTAPKQVGDFIGFSPNGKKMLLYRSSYDNKWGVKVVSISGGPSFTPSLSSAVYESQWSVDSKLILTQSEDEKGDILYKIIPLTGENPVRIKIDVNINGTPFPFTASPDLTQLAFSVKRDDGKKDLYIVPFSMQEARTTGPARLIFDGWSGGAYNVTFSWSPDGTKVALIQEGDIWVIPLEGGNPLQITDTPEGERWVSWSPNGKMISYIIPSKQIGILYTIPASGGIPRIVFNVNNASTWSPNSKSKTIISNNKLLFVSLDGEKIKSIDIPKELKTGNSSGLQYSPDGKHLAFIVNIEDESLIIMYSIKDDEFTRLAFEVLDDYKYSLNWSPDGKWLSYLTYEKEKVRPEGVLWEADFEEVLKKLQQ